MIRVKRHPKGLRLYIIGLRIHHGPPAALAALFAWKHRWKRLAVALGAYAATDWRDVPFTDHNNH